jgi:16S rRNA (uracil1498-N3)-methyltransferase
MMNFPRFYCPEPLSGQAAGCLFTLPEAVARHAVKVLRLRAGDSLVLFDGLGGEYPAQLVEVGRDEASVSLGAWRDVEREAPLPLTLIQAVQAAEKMDLTLQKAVELGVSTFVPAESRRSVVRLSGERAARRLEHWRGVAVAACEQCGRNRLPDVTAISSVTQALASLPTGDGALKLMFLPEATQTLADLPPPSEVSLLVGAEGGLDPLEEQAALAAGFVPVRLGPRVLRTETAGLAALAAIHALWGDFRETKNV